MRYKVWEDMADAYWRNNATVIGGLSEASPTVRPMRRGWFGSEYYAGPDSYGASCSNVLADSGFVTMDGAPVMVPLGDLGPRQIGFVPPHFVSVPGAYWRTK